MAVEGVAPGGVTYVSLSLKPSAGAAVSIPADDPDRPGATLSTYVRVDEAGEVFTLDGDGEGDGVWVATGYRTAMEGAESTEWIDLAYRLDLSAKTYDLYLGGRLYAYDLGFVRAEQETVSALVVIGSREGPVSVRAVAVGEAPFADADRDGVDDAYERQHGLDPTSAEDRAADPDEDGAANVEEFLRGTRAGERDTDGDGLADGQEFRLGANPFAPDAEGRAGVITLETWSGLRGEDPAHLTASRLVASPPHELAYLDRLESAAGQGNHFGARARGHLVAPVSGDYTFWVSGDDSAELWLSTDASRANRRLIAAAPAWTAPGEFDKYPAQRSAPLALVAGARYYLEVVHKEDWFDDHFAVAWQTPAMAAAGADDEPAREIIPGAHLVAWAPDPADGDDDGLPDAWETAHGLDPADPADAAADPDSDALTNAEECLAGTDPNAADTAPRPGRARYEFWKGIEGGAVADLTAAATFPAAPDGAGFVRDLEVSRDLGDDYGLRIRALLHPPLDGDYTFWVAGDDGCELWISDDATPFRRRPAAAVPGWTRPRQWTKYVEQRSDPVPLQAGRAYYIEVLQKGGAHSDHLAVAWQIPGNQLTVIAGRFLSPYLPPAAGGGDDDDDGLPDAWEAQNALSAADPAGAHGPFGTPPGAARRNIDRYCEESGLARPAHDGEAGYARWELWGDLDGGYVHDAARHRGFPARPDKVVYLEELRTPAGYGDRYGSRLRAFLRPPETGTYTFWISGDDRCELWLGLAGADAFSRRKIAHVPGWTAPDDFKKYPQQRSAPVALVAGASYYIEVLHKEGHDNDHLSVAWSIPGKGRRIIDGDYLVCFQPGLAPDADDNGLPDAWETAAGIAADPALAAAAPRERGAYGDPDGDGLDNRGEMLLGKNPLAPDATAEPGRVTWELWTDLPGHRLSDLTGSERFPASPDITSGAERLDCPKDLGDNYAARLRGYLVPPADGTYVLHLSGDDHCALWLSTDASPFNRRLAAEVRPWTGHREGSRYGHQATAPLQLLAGQRYYIEVLQKEGTLEDHLSVSWTLPPAPGAKEGTPGETGVVEGAFLLPYAPLDADRDADGLPDAWESAHGLDPADPALAHGAYGDPDGDGLDNFEEYQLDRHPTEHDSGGAPGFVLWERWDGVDGATVDALLAAPAFPGAPADLRPLAELHAPPDIGDRYGARARGFIVPPEDGTYTFHLAGDDGCEFWLSTDGDKRNRARAAAVPGWSGPAQFDRYPAQTSAPAGLLAGQRYFFELLHKEAGGDDHLTLAWTKPGGETTIVGAAHLVSYRPPDWDLDDDDLPDDWETAHGLDPASAARDQSAYGDADADGLSNLEEFNLGTDPLAADSDADGLDDFLEARWTGTDPLAAGGEGAEVLQEINGSAAVPVSGQWRASGDRIHSVGRRGGILFRFEVAAAGFFLLELEGLPIFGGGRTQTFDLDLGVDGAALGRFRLAGSVFAPGRVRVMTPYLLPGVHDLEVFWDNARRGRAIMFNRLTVSGIGGEDADGDGVADWAADLLAERNRVTSAPVDSPVSPAPVEGVTDAFPALEATSADLPLEVHPGIGTGWYADLPLAEEGFTAATFSFSRGARTETHEIRWVPTDVLASGDLTVRACAALRLTAGAGGDADARAGEVEVRVDGETTALTTAAEPVVHEFPDPGVYRVEATLRTPGQPAAEGGFTLTVVRADLGAGVTLYAGRPRAWTCPGLPAEATLEADASLRLAEPDPAADPRAFELYAAGPGKRRLLARLPDGGPVLDGADARVLSLSSGSDTDLRVAGTYADGSQLVEMTVVVSGLTADTRVLLEIIVGGVVFIDGTTVKELTAEDFDDLGAATVRFIRPAAALTSVCHRVSVWEGNQLIGSR